jgi:hypothetical protein
MALARHERRAQNQVATGFSQALKRQRRRTGSNGEEALRRHEHCWISFFAKKNPILVAGGRLKMAARFLGNTGAAPKQAHRIRAVDAEFIGLLTLIDRFPPTDPDRFGQVRGPFTPFSPEIVFPFGELV